MADLTGRTLADRYYINSLLGHGGMGDVYKVWDNQRAVFLALKVLHSDFAEDLVFLRRFEREAQTLAALQHPHIVRFYGMEQDGSLTFMLMEYVEGVTLRKQIFEARKPLAPNHILQVTHAVCAALHYAHKMGRVHCDIKPANIMMKANGDILVADFGIARMLESGTTMTMVGAGTPAYMAPEQALGLKPLPQTDIYALGIVLYEMLTGGERPFVGDQAEIEGSTAERVRWEHTKLMPPSPRKYDPAISPAIESVVLKCLEKDPAQRYAGALELMQAVQSAFLGTSELGDMADVTQVEGQVEVAVPLPPRAPSTAEQNALERDLRDIKEQMQRLTTEKNHLERPVKPVRRGSSCLSVLLMFVLIIIGIAASVASALFVETDVATAPVSSGISNLRTPSFAAGEDIYVYFASDKPGANQKFESRWYYKKNLFGKDFFIFIGQVEYTANYESIVFMNLNNPGIAGEYVVEIYLDQRLVGTQTFTIDPAEQ